MDKFRSGDFVIVDAGDILQTMWSTPKYFDALVINKMTPDSHEEFYSLLWDGKLVVAPAVRMHHKELFSHIHTGEKNE